MILEQIPKINQIYILIHKKNLQPTSNQFNKIINSSFIFKNLHKHYKTKLNNFINHQIKIIKNNITQPNLNLNKTNTTQLKIKLNLIINYTNLINFNPNIRNTLSTNITNNLIITKFTKQYKNTTLLHISTYYIINNHSNLIKKNNKFTILPHQNHI